MRILRVAKLELGVTVFYPCVSSDSMCSIFVDRRCVVTGTICETLFGVLISEGLVDFDKVIRRSIELVSSLEKRNGYDEDVLDHLASALVDQFSSSLCRTAGSDEIVNDQYARVGSQGSLLHFEHVLSVFLLVGSLDALAGKLADFADGDESTPESLGDGGAEQEASSVETYDCIDLAVAVRLGTRFERGGRSRRWRVVVERRDGVRKDVRDNVGEEQFERQRIAKDGKNVAESNALLGVVVVET